MAGQLFNMAGQVMSPAPATGRVSRRPRHTFYGRCQPFQIQPMLLAPVLPGETLKNLLIQARVVTDPVANSLIGWWLEYYVFYVKHRDLDDRDTFTAMHLDLTTDMSTLKAAGSTDARHFRTDGSINWSELCLKRVVEEYFREEGEAWDVVTIDGLPSSSTGTDNWLDSVVLADDVNADTQLVDEAGSGTLTANELTQAMQQWEFMRAASMTNASFEDYLRSFGVRVNKEEPHKPELLRYVREWQYPSSVVSPSDGFPQSAVSWALSESADKDRFFTEPGFIFGVTVARPKVYFQTDGSLANYLDRALDWLPAIMRDEPYTSLKHYANGTGPLPAVTDSNGYWIDLRDLFIHGDQFMFGASSFPDDYTPSLQQYPNVVDLPTPGLNVAYPDEADAQGMFLYASTSRYYVRQDGVVTLNILGTQRDVT